MKLLVEGGFRDNRLGHMLFMNDEREILCRLVGSPTCCGVHEFGSFQRISTTQAMKDVIKDTFDYAVMNKGIIYSYLPKDLSSVDNAWMQTWREILLMIGFQEEKEFFNPNSGHEVTQYVFASYARTKDSK